MVPAGSRRRISPIFCAARSVTITLSAILAPISPCADCNDLNGIVKCAKSLTSIAGRAWFKPMEIEAMEAASTRARYACDPGHSRGRLHAEPESQSRSAFRRDCDRIIHSTAFRRLKHKTQVFVFDEGDHYRTRLTHTLEVTQVARALARAAPSRRRPRRGAGARPRSRPSAVRSRRRARARCLPRRVRRFRSQRPDPAHRHRAGAPLSEFRRTEPDLGNAGGPGQAQRPAHRSQRRAARPLSRARRPGDDPATTTSCRTCNYGASPALRRRSPPSPTTSPMTLMTSTTACAPRCFGIDDIADVPLPGRIIADIRAAYPDLDEHRLVHELIRQLIGFLIDDVVAETGRRLARLGPHSADDVRKRRRAGCRLLGGYGGGGSRHQSLPQAAYVSPSARHARDGRGGRRSARPVRPLQRASRRLAGGMAEGLAGLDDAARARSIADFIAGMTDRYALAEHGRLFDSTPELR